MDKYYFIYSPTNLNGLYKKYTYKQYISAANNGGAGSYWKILKTDFNALEKGLKGVILKDKTRYIFDRLHAAGKAARAY